MAAALFVVRFVGEKAPVHAAEWWIGDLALASLVAAPAVLGLFGARGRESLLLPAGVLSVALSLTFLSGAGLPLIIPGALYLIAYARLTERRTSTPAVLLPLVLVVVSFGLLLIGSYRIACWKETRLADGRTVISRDRAAERLSSQGSFRSSRVPNEVVSAGCTDGAIDPVRSILSLTATAAAVVAGRAFA